MKNLLSLIGAGLIGGLIVVGAMKLTGKKVNVSPNTNVVRFASDVNTVGAIDLSVAAATASPTVVYIEAAESRESAQKRAQEYYDNDPFAQFFGFGFRQPQKKGTGSGVIISKDGYIVTNNHVVDFADNVNVSLSDNRKFVAKVVGTDARYDLAVLKIDASDLPAVQKGNSDNLRIGEWVLAIGFPYDIGTTVTAGIVSATHKKIGVSDTRSSMEDLIQTDAVVNPGNSGGALVDASGKLVGINTAIQTRTGSYEGYSFAIPVSVMAKIVDEIVKNGGKRPVVPPQAQSQNNRGRLGVIMVADQYFQEVAAERNLNVASGVIIDNVQDGSSAQYAGLLPNDVIIKIENRAVTSTNDVRNIIAQAKAGDNLRLIIFRNGKSQDVTVTLRS